MQESEKGTMTVYELMDYFGIGRRQAYQLASSKGFPSFRVGARILISREGLKKWMENGGTSDSSHS